MKKRYPLVDVVIPVYKPEKEFRKLIERLLRQTCSIHNIIIIQTQCKGYSVRELLSRLRDSDLEKIIIKDIKQSEFNHGLTRNKGMSLSSAEFVIMMTQDAIPADEYMVENLLAPFEDEGVCVAYARQLPRKDCRLVERYVRSFNYPDRDMVKTKDTFETLGIKNIFCSDVCAAYRREEHIRLGGFQETDFNEDMIFAYGAIMAGKKVYYASKAKVIHSHNYSYLQQFRRNIDIGRSQKKFKDIFGQLKSENEGMKLLKSGISYLIKQGKWYYIPDFIIGSGFKFVGYRIGKL